MWQWEHEIEEEAAGDVGMRRTTAAAWAYSTGTASLLRHRSGQGRRSAGEWRERYRCGHSSELRFGEGHRSAGE